METIFILIVKMLLMKVRITLRRKYYTKTYALYIVVICAVLYFYHMTKY